jgi:hypothetical protein
MRRRTTLTIIEGRCTDRHQRLAGIRLPPWMHGGEAFATCRTRPSTLNYRCPRLLLSTLRPVVERFIESSPNHELGHTNAKPRPCCTDPSDRTHAGSWPSRSCKPRDHSEEHRYLGSAPKHPEMSPQSRSMADRAARMMLTQ